MNVRRSSLLLAATLFAAAPAMAMSPWEAADAAIETGHPVASYISLPMLEIQHHAQIFGGPASSALPIYLNRFGGSYSCGNDDSATNVSSVVCGSNGGDVGSFSGSDSQWTFVRGCVQDMFAPFNVYVTDIEPTGLDYVEAVVGGVPGDAGMPNGVGGVAPFTCGLIPNGIVYAFSDVYGNDMQGVCETVAQEVAHAFGLDHEFMCEDPMTYLGGCGEKSFQDVYAQCGEFEPRECQCGNADSQNSVQQMLQSLGASDGTPPPPPPVDTELPVIALGAPDADAILPANSTINVSITASDDTQLTLVQLDWDFSGETFFCPASVEQTGNYECSRSGSTYTWSIAVGVGGRTYRARVRDIAGNTVESEDRSIWLSEDGSGPPDDNAPPDVIIASPLDGAVLETNAPLAVVATIADDAGVARGDLVWTNGQGEEQVFPCPLETQGVSCAIDGTTYTWILDVGTGNRSFYVRATDIVGNVTESGIITLGLQTNAPVAVDDDDDTIDRATELACGESREVLSSDVDWFVVDAPADRDVEVVVSGDAQDSVELLATTGPTSAEHIQRGSPSVDFPGGEPVKIGVLPAGADAGTYTIEVTCTEHDEDGGDGPSAGSLGGCAATGAEGMAPFGLALVALAARRRRRAA